MRTTYLMAFVGLLTLFCTPHYSMCAEQKQEEVECSICLDPMNEDACVQLPLEPDQTVQLKYCGHNYHFSCITDWAKGCPLCRKESFIDIAPSSSFVAKCIALAQTKQELEELARTSQELEAELDEEIRLKERLAQTNERLSIRVRQQKRAIKKLERELPVLKLQHAKKVQQLTDSNTALANQLQAQKHTLEQFRTLTYEIEQLKKVTQRLNTRHQEEREKLITTNTELQKQLQAEETAIQQEKLRLQQAEADTLKNLVANIKHLSLANPVGKGAQETRRAEQTQQLWTTLTTKLKKAQRTNRCKQRTILNQRRIIESQQRRLAEVPVGASLRSSIARSAP